MRISTYAILSHTWGGGEDDEVTFKDLVNGTAENKKGYEAGSAMTYAGFVLATSA